MDYKTVGAQLQAAQSAAKNPTDIYNQAAQSLGVNAARDTVQGLRGAINNTTQLLQKVAPSVMGRTAQSLVTNAQANRQIQNESAPLQQNLSSQTNQYNQASQDYQDLANRATQQANMAYQGQQDKLSYLQNLYNVLYGQQQDAWNRYNADRQFQEGQRQFNESLKAKAASAASSGGSSGSSGSSSGPTYQQRSGGGFNFQNASGKAISARLFAQLTGTDFNTLLRQMAASGDSGAADVLKHGASSKAYKALTWD